MSIAGVVDSGFMVYSGSTFAPSIAIFTAWLLPGIVEAGAHRSLRFKLLTKFGVRVHRANRLQLSPRMFRRILQEDGPL